MKLLLVACLALAGCVESQALFGADNGPACAGDAMSPAWALDPATGICLEFSSCDVPSGWATCMPYVPCVEDTACTAVQHCADLPMSEDPSLPPRACVANASCAETGTCADGYYCDSATATCTRTGVAPPPPAAPSCLATSECGALEICPAQYGGCSAEEMPTDVPCPSQCEPACTSDDDCGDPMTLRCNFMDVCGAANSDEMGNPGPTCAGWCVPR